MGRAWNNHNDLTKREAQVLIKRKFPPRQSGCAARRTWWARNVVGAAIYGVDAPRPAPRLIGPRRIFRGGGEAEAWKLEPRWASRLTPRGWRVSQGLSELEQAGV